MPTFPVSGPIQANLAIHAGDVTIVGSDIGDEVMVEVRPRDPSSDPDVKAAGRVRVELANEILEVKTVRQGLGRLRDSGAVAVRIALPMHSKVDGHLAVGDLRAEGSLGDFTFKTGAGEVRVGSVASLRAITGAGELSVDAVTGDVLAVTGSGAVRLGTVQGNIIVKNGNGGTTIGVVEGTVRVSAANGDVVIGHAAQAVSAKTANGSIRVGAVVSGDVDLKTAFGTVEVGIAHGTAAKLDVKTTFGLLRQELDPTGAPPSSVKTASVKARTSHGDITIRRAEEEAVAA
jgi:hypothetical protein